LIILSVGKSAGAAITTGVRNNCFGLEAAVNLTTGSDNTFIGKGCSPNVTTGSGNIAIGDISNVGTRIFNLTTEDDRIIMGHHNITNAYVKVAWTVTSDARDKSNFAEVPHGLSFVNQLVPYSYEFKLDRDEDETDGIVRYGFKAQDILALEGDNPVIIDNEHPDKLQYRETALIPILVKALQEADDKIDALTTRIEALEG
jgi:trimeric autotransporter adhesin